MVPTDSRFRPSQILFRIHLSFFGPQQHCVDFNLLLLRQLLTPLEPQQREANRRKNRYTRWLLLSGAVKLSKADITSHYLSKQRVLCNFPDGPCACIYRGSPLWVGPDATLADGAHATSVDGCDSARFLQAGSGRCSMRIAVIIFKRSCLKSPPVRRQRVTLYSRLDADMSDLFQPALLQSSCGMYNIGMSVLAMCTAEACVSVAPLCRKAPTPAAVPLIDGLVSRWPHRLRLIPTALPGGSAGRGECVRHAGRRSLQGAMVTSSAVARLGFPPPCAW